MIDQEKILGHREPYNGMGEAVGLLRLMSNSSEAKWANELKIKDQGRTSQETKEQKSRNQRQETEKTLRSIKRTH